MRGRNCNIGADDGDAGGPLGGYQHLTQIRSLECFLGGGGAFLFLSSFLFCFVNIL